MTERMTVRKWFWVWDFEKEEDWLNEMAMNGWALASVGFLLDREGRGIGLVEDVYGFQLYLDVARGHLRVLAGAFDHLPGYLDDEFPSEGRGRFHERGKLVHALIVGVLSPVQPRRGKPRQGLGQGAVGGRGTCSPGRRRAAPMAVADGPSPRRLPWSREAHPPHRCGLVFNAEKAERRRRRGCGV